MDNNTNAMTESRSSVGSVEEGSSSLELHSGNGLINPSAHHIYDESLYRLHRYAFEDDLKAFTALISSRDKGTDVSLKDMHGKLVINCLCRIYLKPE